MPHTAGLRSLLIWMILLSSPKVCFNYIIHLPFTGRRDEEASSLHKLSQHAPVSISLTSCSASQKYSFHPELLYVQTKIRCFYHYEIRGDQIFQGKGWSLIQVNVWHVHIEKNIWILWPCSTNNGKNICAYNCRQAAAAAKSLQSCLTLYPSLPDSGAATKKWNGCFASQATSTQHPSFGLRVLSVKKLESY